MKNRKLALNPSDLVEATHQLQDLRIKLVDRLSKIRKLDPDNLQIHQYFSDVLLKLSNINSKLNNVSDEMLKLKEIKQPGLILNKARDLSTQIDNDIKSQLVDISKIELATRNIPEKLNRIKEQTEKIQSLEAKIEASAETLDPHAGANQSANNIIDRLHHLSIALLDLAETLNDQKNPHRLLQSNSDILIENIYLEINDIEHHVALYGRISNGLAQNAADPAYIAVKIPENIELSADHKSLADHMMQGIISQENIATLLQIKMVHDFIQNKSESESDDLNLIDKLKERKLQPAYFNSFLDKFYNKINKENQISLIDVNNINDLRNDLFLKIENKEISSAEIDLLLNTDLIKLNDLLSSSQHKDPNQFKLALTACMFSNPYLNDHIVNHNKPTINIENKSDPGEELPQLNTPKSTTPIHSAVNQLDKFEFKSSTSLLQRLMAAPQTDLSLRGQRRELTKDISHLNRGRIGAESKQKLSQLAQPERKEALKIKPANLDDAKQDISAIFIPIDSATVDNKAVTNDANNEFVFVPIKESDIDNMLAEQNENDELEYIFEPAPPTPAAKIPHQHGAFENENNEPENTVKNIKAL